MSENYRELSDKVVDEAEQNPSTPTPKPQVEYEICKSCGTLMPLNGNCPLCSLTRKNIDEDMFSKYKRSE